MSRLENFPFCFIFCLLVYFHRCRELQISFCVEMFLDFSDNRARFDFLIHKVLFLSITNVLAFKEVEMIASEEVKFVLHLPDFGFFNFSFCDWQRVGFAFRLPQM